MVGETKVMKLSKNRIHGIKIIFKSEFPCLYTSQLSSNQICIKLNKNAGKFRTVVEDKEGEDAEQSINNSSTTFPQATPFINGGSPQKIIMV